MAEPSSVKLDLEDEASLCAQACGLSLERVRELEEFARQRQEPLIDVLVTKGDVDEKLLLRSLADRLGLPYLSENLAKIDDATLSKLSASLAIRFHVIPVDEAADG